MSVEIKKQYSSRTADKFVVRLEDGMRSDLQILAKAAHRSMNSEIVTVLKHHIRRCDQGIVPLDDPLAELVKRLDVQPWVPRIGDLVRRRDRQQLLGTIRKFYLSDTTVMVEIESIECGTENHSQALALLVPVDIREVIEQGNLTVQKALVRAAERLNM